MSRRGRSLTQDERRIWAEIARQVRPLRASAKVEPEPDPEPPPAPPVPRKLGKPRKAAVAPAEAAPQPPPKPSGPPPLAALERRMLRALARGRLAVDASLDLHGMTESAAHARLGAFLRGARASGFRLVLVVTGHGGGAEGRGIIRRNVPHWLGQPELRAIVSGFEEAGPRQGGAGALYVRLRRQRPGP